MSNRWACLVTDLDGTLLRSDGSLSQTVIKAAFELKANHIPLILASARSQRSAGWVHRTLQLDTPFVTFNGAVVMDPSLTRVLHQTPLPSATALAIVDALWRINPDLNPSIETAAASFRQRCDAVTVATVKRFGGVMPTVLDLRSVLERPDVSVAKLSFRTGDQDPAPYLAALDAFGTAVSATRSSADDMVEVMGPGVTKATGIGWVLDWLGLPWSQVAAAGDSLNDVAMLQAAGLAAAVANAHVIVRQVAAHQLPSCDQDGVAVLIRERLEAPSGV